MKAIKSRQFELAIALCALAANAFAASPISVSNTNDDGDGSLRVAITQANEAGGGEITFYLTNSITNTITLLSPLPSLTNITLTGPGTNVLTISGDNQVRVFSMESGTTNTLSGLTIANGMAVDYDIFKTFGSGISNAGCLNLLNCAILDCAAGGQAGYGAGIYNAGNLEMQACVIDGCGYFVQGGMDLDGGGLFNLGTGRMSDCTVAHCSADRGGGIYNDGGSLLLTNCIVDSCANDYGEGDGPALYNDNGDVVLHTSIITNCEAGWWGALTSFGGDLAATNTTIAGNYYALEGGGMFLQGGSNLFVGCTISGNSGGAGGGILNNSILTLLNCTISQNYSYEGEGTLGNGVAGGILNGTSYYFSGETIHLNSCTVVSNTAASYSSDNPGGIENDGGSVYAGNSIIAANSTNDFFGVLTSEGYNLIQNTNGCTIVGDQTGNLYGADPLIGPLQDNGGPTWTHALLTNSPCIDQGTSGGLTTDQRGAPRPYDVSTIPNAAGGDGSDIGAYEWTPPPTACGMAAQTIQNQPLTISTAKLLLCASSPMNHALRLSGVSANSTNGGTVVLAGDTVTYTPATNFIGPDLFTYTMNDGWGGTAAGEMLVSVIAGNAPSSNMLPAVYTAGDLLVSFAGIVGRTYSVQRAPAVTGPWVSIGAATVGPTGIGSLEDTNPPPGSAFYRTAFP